VGYAPISMVFMSVSRTVDVLLTFTRMPNNAGESQCPFLQSVIRGMVLSNVVKDTVVVGEGIFAKASVNQCQEQPEFRCQCSVQISPALTYISMSTRP